MADFQKGDIVSLKSGGPVMTIENIGSKAYSGEGEKDHAWCQWFEKNKLTTGVFPLASLEAATKPGGFHIGTVTRG